MAGSLTAPPGLVDGANALKWLRAESYNGRIVMTDANGDSPDDFHEDLAVVRKHSRFIALAVLGAILVAIASGFVVKSDYRSTAEIETKIEVSPVLFGTTESVVTLNTLVELANSEELAMDVADRLQLDDSPSELLDRIRVTSTPATRDDLEDVIQIRADADSASRAEELANTWADAFVERALVTTADPDVLASLNEQVEDAFARLNAIDPAMERRQEQATADLREARTGLAELKLGLTQVEEVLTFIESNPAASIAELLVALAPALGEETDVLGTVSNVEELRQGLELRRDVLESSIRTLEERVPELANEEERLRLANGERAAAEFAWQTSIRSLQSSQVAAASTTIVAQVTERAGGASGGANWIPRLGAAVAFGLVVGIAGAFALEYLGPRLARARNNRGPAADDRA
jgi:capsular polysaccharide biosynthesis protein